MRRLPEALTLAAAAMLLLGACSTIDLRWPPRSQDTAEHGNGIRDPDVTEATAKGDTPEPDRRGADQEAGERDAESGVSGRLLGEADDWLALSPEAQREQLAVAETRYLEDKTAANLNRYALLVALSRSERPQDLSRARDDLRAWLASDEASAIDDAYAPLGRIVLRMLDERERLMAQWTARNEELQRKLDELKAIEQQLRERDSTEIIRTLP